MNTSIYKFKVYKSLVGTETKEIIEVIGLNYTQAKILKKLFKDLNLKFDIKMEEK